MDEVNQATQWRRDKVAAILWARRLFTGKQDFVVFDSETTGLEDAEFVQIAVVDTDGQALVNTHIKPSVPITEGARAVHGICDDDLVAAPTFAEIWPSLRQALDGRRLIIYNASFDGPILARMSCATQTIAPECAMEWYARFRGEWSDYHSSYTWRQLPGGDHTALGDARATLAVIRRIADARIET